MQSFTQSVAVVVVSDDALRDPDENRAGPVAVELLEALGAAVGQQVVGHGIESVQQAVLQAVRSGARLVLTCGGTGIRPEEVTVEATRPLLTQELPGIAEEVRRVGREKTPLALLSGGLAGVVEADGRRAVVVNSPGTRGGVRDTVAVLAPLLGHLVAGLDGAPRD